MSRRSRYFRTLWGKKSPESASDQAAPREVPLPPAGRGAAAQSPSPEGGCPAFRQGSRFLGSNSRGEDPACLGPGTEEGHLALACQEGKDSLSADLQGTTLPQVSAAPGGGGFPLSGAPGQSAGRSWTAPAGAGAPCPGGRTRRPAGSPPSSRESPSWRQAGSLHPLLMPRKALPGS